MKYWLKTVFSAAPILVFTAIVMIPDVLFCAYGLLTDHTLIIGAPAWEKPMKFGLSTAIYAFSIAVIVRYTAVWPKMLRVADLLTGLSLVVEIAIIDLQAARHTTSHFNFTSSLNADLWAVMGIGIGILWISGIVVTVATFRSEYQSRPWTIVARYGMLIAILGMASGGFMAFPSRAQRQAVTVTHHLGAHTFGGPDGGPGLPVLNWSTQHGDGRPSHFIGMHAIQVLALLAWLLERFRLSEARASRILSVAVVSYGSLFALTLTEALSKDPITDHSQIFVIAWSSWLVMSVVLFVVAARRYSAEKQRSTAGLEATV